MLWQGQRRCVDALPCNYNEIRSVANIAIAKAAATATPRKEQQLQLQLAPFKQLLLLGQVVCFVLLGVFFVFFGCCPQRVFSCVQLCLPLLLLLLPLALLSLACAFCNSYNYFLGCLGQNWPCGPTCCFLASLANILSKVNKMRSR